MYQVTNNGRTVFSGSLSQVKEWANRSEDYLGKIITFNYRPSYATTPDSRNGLRRVVIVNEVTADGIKGMDLTRKSSTDHGNRNFTRSRMSSIEVANLEGVV